MLDQKNDTELSQLFCKSDKKFQDKIIAVLYERYFAFTLSYIVNRFENLPDSELADLVVEAYSEKLPKELAKSCQKQEFLQSCKAWIGRVCVNAAINLLRKKKSKIVNIDDVEKDDLERLDDETRPYEESDRNLVELAMGLLRADRRNVAIAFFIWEWSYQEISDKLNYSMREVKTNLQGAKRDLTKILEDAKQINLDDIILSEKEFDIFLKKIELDKTNEYDENKLLGIIVKLLPAEFRELFAAYFIKNKSLLEVSELYPYQNIAIDLQKIKIMVQEMIQNRRLLRINSE